MSFLSRFKILPKILAVILLLSAITGGVATLGINALKSLSNAAARMEASAARAMLTQQLAVDLITMSRAEFQMSADPRKDSRAAARHIIADETKLFRHRLQEFGSRADDATRHIVAELEEGWANYQKDLEGTYRAAEAVTEFQLTEQMQRLHDAAERSAQVANTLRVQLRDLAESLQKTVAGEAAAAADEYTTVSREIIVLAALGIALGLLVSFLIGQYGISRPIRAIVALLQQLAAGDYNTTVAGTDRKDEVGDIAKAAVIFKENGLAKIRLEQEQKAAADQAETQRKSGMQRLADEFEKSVGGIVGMLASAATEMQATATQLTASAQETSAQSNAVTSAAEIASSNVTSVAGSAEELGASVSEIGRQAERSTQMTRSAVEEIEAASATVGELSEAAARIDTIADMISTIAAQTNLLALNATIEAARAGEAGRGFAVVAAEVKELATQTAKATAEISEQLTGIQASSGKAVAAIQSLTGTVREIDTSATAISAAVEQQGAATREIVQAVAQASLGAGEVTSNISGVAAAAEQTGIAANQVQTSSAELAARAEQLRDQVDSFLADVRAA